MHPEAVVPRVEVGAAVGDEAVGDASCIDERPREPSREDVRGELVRDGQGKVCLPVQFREDAEERVREDGPGERLDGVLAERVRLPEEADPIGPVVSDVSASAWYQGSAVTWTCLRRSSSSTVRRFWNAVKVAAASWPATGSVYRAAMAGPASCGATSASPSADLMMPTWMSCPTGA